MLYERGTPAKWYVSTLTLYQSGVFSLSLSLTHTHTHTHISLFLSLSHTHSLTHSVTLTHTHTQTHTHTRERERERETFKSVATFDPKARHMLIRRQDKKQKRVCTSLQFFEITRTTSHGLHPLHLSHTQVTTKTNDAAGLSREDGKREKTIETLR
eukprot:TRINITY_DN9750_c1_g1_i6.p2 TRINITY_DN9750_c1_g1~~TRINITY_DN9750_c1_g1_i6.p2  ORF type:complete len:156 (+),score=4.24 TRINITY_DN9750_c1_g1_i6:36-503(+)